ncbi:MAG: hypothetical protein RQ891_07110 [Thermoflexus sp.]|jgi:hypothetical protein|uniref:HTH HARE-type domain-containing protein n=1 Tax=Thermoflexus hugenholtzii JAD2 TaxID=877466 RepID=A0A212R510_9CHLR|nr:MULTISPECIES: hypothetical protein [Thermoflexus]MDT7884608.1 hypothetical protein [Thermoflexus sp.]MDT7948226.1 hypothetical protein [Thermoflexus sp.]QWK09524.1 MAG: hypothetical protein KNN16_09085 [Thermoflexus hugenholtzii]SNB67164.1 hypothetical protein SAMN02746019_00010470 [Thermoflexus hugenholtzii JAD2]
MKEILESRINLLRSQLADIEQRRDYVQAQLRLLEDIAQLLEKYPTLGEGLVGLFRQTTMPRRRRTRELVNALMDVLKTSPQGMELEAIRKALLERGIQVPGKNEQMQRARLTLIFRKNQDLFQRVRRGVYQLKV